MIEQDTIRLLRECDAGVKMGISSLDDVIPSVHRQKLKTMLEDCRNAHCKLEDELQIQLNRYQDEGKKPNPMAQGMSWIKTNVMLMMHDNDQTIADLMSDGCAMGIKSLSKYLNQYEAADETSKDIAKRLIQLEDQLVKDLRPYL